MSAAARTRVEVPPGVQCFVGEEARRRRALERAVLGVFDGWGYEEIIPPLFDFADVFAGPALEARTYSFVGRDGSLLALRPDFTSLIAKMVGGRLAGRPRPLRLFYAGEVLRYETPKAGRQSELYQVGLEHIGGVAPEADAEVLAVAAEGLQAAGVSEYVLALGHVGVFAGLLEGTPLEPLALERLRERVDVKDAPGAAAVLRGAGAPARLAEAVARLAGLGGEPDALDEARSLCAFSAPAQAAVEELAAITGGLAGAGLGARVRVDLTEVRGLDYYTGLLFRVYAPGLGFELGGGGRYDTLLGRFGTPSPAVGFSFGLDRLALALERNGAAAPAEAPAVEAGGLADARRLRASGTRVRVGRAR
ncbi:MAG TPA: ATP phosphoribosyltransferase regulatory subunit [Vicinamibacteria bacterium]|jgi:ATP phosphoribosyltransferase regulatory subunit